MRPDWRPAEGVASRVLFAEQRLRLTLPRICADLTRARLDGAKRDEVRGLPPAP
jgi:hypothetical protein